MEFYNSQQMRDVLAFLVEESLANRGLKIKAYTIATEVLGRSTRFDPQIDSSVRVVINKLRKRLKKFYDLRGTLSPYKISIPMGRYMAEFLPCDTKIQDSDNGELPHSVLESNSGSFEMISDQTSLHATTVSTPNTPVILVCPFSNLSADAEVSHIVSGFVEEIVIGLTRFDDFTVISANYNQNTQSSDIDPWSLARQIGARFVLEGNIQVLGNSMRVRVILRDAGSRRSIWAEHYDSDFNTENVFHVLDEITNKVLAGIAGSFGFINKILLTEVEKENMLHRSTHQFSAYEAVLRYHHWIGTLNVQNQQKAQSALEAAIQADPHYGLAKAMLADVYATSTQWCPDDEEVYRLERLSMKLALEAEALNPNCQYAQWAKAVNFFFRREDQAFVDTARLVVSINPANTNLVNAAGLRLVSYGLREEGLSIIENSRKFNPFLPEWYRLATFLVHYMDGDLEGALHEANQIRWPGYVAGPVMRTAVLGKMGRFDDAQMEINKIIEIAPQIERMIKRLLVKLYYHDHNVEEVIDGLNKAGLKIK